MNTVKYPIMLLVLVLLSGCMFPQSEKAANSLPNDAQLAQVQNAVDKFKQQQSGRLPIKTKPEETPVFQKYQIDFTRLKEAGLLMEIPGTAFENGGYYQYIIIKPETEAKVKVVDLRITEKIREIETKLHFYEEKNQFTPYKERIAPGVYSLDHEKLNLDGPPTVKSPYSGELLPLYVNGSGDVLIDYRKDLNSFLKEYDHSYDTGEDIRYLLTQHSAVAPVYSPPYTIENGEPVFMQQAP
ncbi:hypothetical protein AAV35_006100 [Salimicrobium jeotgali]|uniref:Lipoprotein n=2 Tax=Salimicrobium TaxID=351195 RepID=K2HAI9_9BACI|nr:MULTISPECIES: hypothetical protein [Salimicrobium]AKG04403.1 hypothetical protein AAV35_006100 [Salimicrobium jeotgali]EKE32595.1 hypothetical protein MJ3_01517 [Salimicrobium jeotgali]MBM7695422.1 hypothetical protein [Salimicrobium jeotgali]SIS55868.1 hypothetical protein SAMN05421758_102323 [Salimicrobium salexigens]